MIALRIHINDSEVDAMIARIKKYVHANAKLDAAEVTIADIRRKTAAGVDADNHPFSAYVSAYKKVRQKKNLQTSHKDLRVSGKTLDGIHFELGISAIVPAEGTEKIVEGQMNHPAWAQDHHSKFFLVGSDTVTRIEETLAKNIVNLN